MLTGLLTLGAIALGLIAGKKTATGIGRIKRRIYVEMEAAQQLGVDFEQKYMDLSNSQKNSLEEVGTRFGWKQSKRSMESGKPYSEAYFNSLKRAYNAISGIAPIGATPYTSHSVRNGNGNVILTWRDYAPAEEHVQAETPVKVKPAKTRSNKKEDTGLRRFGSDWYSIDADKSKLYEFYEHLCVITNGLIEMAKAAGRFDADGNVPDDNTLLLECYNLVDHEIHTYGEWEDLGFIPEEHQHPYLIWKPSSLYTSGKHPLYVPCNERNENDVLFVYYQDQVEKAEDNVYNIEKKEAELRKQRNKLRRSGRTKNLLLEPAPNLQAEEPANTNYVPEVHLTKQQQILEMWPYLRTYDSDIEAYEEQPDGTQKSVYPITDNFNYVVWKKIKAPNGTVVAEGAVMAFINRDNAEREAATMKAMSRRYDEHFGNAQQTSISVKSVADVKLDKIAGIGYVDFTI